MPKTVTMAAFAVLLVAQAQAQTQAPEPPAALQGQPRSAEPQATPTPTAPSRTSGAPALEGPTRDEAMRAAARAAWGSTGTINENKAVVTRALNTVMKEQRLDLAPEFYGDPYLQNNPNIPDGVDSMKGYFAEIFAAFPNYAPTVDLMVAEGDLVSVYLTWRGAHTGAPYQGVEPRGTNVIVKTADIFRIRDGRVVEHWDIVDRTGLLEPLGLMTVRQRAPQPLR